MTAETRQRTIAAITVLVALAMMTFATFRFVSSYRTAMVHTLIKRLRAGSDRSRYKAARELAKMGAPAAGPLLTELRSKDDMTWALASFALGRMGSPAIEPLNKALNDHDEEIRTRAVIALGQNKDACATTILISAFGNTSHRVGRAAALAFSSRGSKAIHPLLTVLGNKNPVVRANAAIALGLINVKLEKKDKRAVLPLIGRLKDANKTVRALSAQALGSIGDSRAVEPLITTFTNGLEYSSARYRASQSLGQIGGRRAVDVLIKALGDKTESADVRSMAAMALGYPRDSRVLAPLEAALKDKDSFVQSCARDSLKSQRMQADAAP